MAMSRKLRESRSVFSQSRVYLGVILQVGQHLVKTGSPRLFGRLRISELPRYLELFPERRFPQEFELGRNGEPLLLLLLAGDPSVDHGLISVKR